MNEEIKDDILPARVPNKNASSSKAQSLLAQDVDKRLKNLRNTVANDFNDIGDLVRKVYYLVAAMVPKEYQL